ncbi:MAG: efflux RND transporter periplasmic adaptor subunit [Planctomycetales bacterium]
MAIKILHRRSWLTALTVGVLSFAWIGLRPKDSAALQDEEQGGGGARKGEQEVVIKREALQLTDPRRYRASMHLQAARSVALIAPVDGFVRTVSAKPQQKVNPQNEVIRLDDQRANLVLKRAKAQLQAAQLEKKIGQGRGDADQMALLDARLEAAQAESDLAQLEVDQLVVRAPFAGEIERVHVVEGQFVRAGEPLAVLSDPTKLTVEVPVEREAAIPGNLLEIKVEESAVKGKIDAVIPLGTPFEPLRDLTVSPASALVSIDNAQGRLAPGQTVYSDLIPLAPVALVPSVAISNLSDGNRKVQVLRENVVRDLSVRIMSKVGTESVFVSGRFIEGDEVIVSANRPLADGTPLRALLAGSSSAGKGSAPARSSPGSGGTGSKKSNPSF